LPLLRLIAHRLCDYIRDHKDKIEEHIGEENVDTLNAALVACDLLCDVLDVIIPHGA